MINTVDTLYSDENIVIFIKPPGLSVEADTRGGLSLCDIARRDFGETYPCHRLDNQTGGLVVFARNAASRDELLRVFRLSSDSGVIGEKSRDGISKAYMCEVANQPMKPSGELVHYLLKDSGSATVRAYRSQVRGSRFARTLYRVVRFGESCIVEARPLTGRTHQIRVQFAAAGFPILGDDKYGDRQANKARRVRTQRLWSVELTFRTSGVLGYLRGKTFRINAPFG